MIARVGRLMAAETIKLAAHPFLYVALVLITLGIAGGEIFAASAQKSSPWGGVHAVHLFSYGFQAGLKLGTYALVIFSSMLIAGEFDRGTIKVLLTRPVRRAELFVAKSLTVLILAGLLFAFILAVAGGWALSQGSLGPVWDDTAYLVQRSGAEIEAHAWKGIGISVLSFFAAGFLGLLVSTWTESSGFAVAIALILFLFGDVAQAALPGKYQLRTFFHYGPYAVAKLQEFAAGGSARWSPDILGPDLHIKVPLLYIAGFLPLAYARFHLKDIHA